MLIKNLPPKDNSIGIVLAHLNGGKLLKVQLESIYNQLDKMSKIYLFDDLSDPNSQAILTEIQKVWGEKLSVTTNQSKYGFCKNFLNGLASIDQNHEYYAFCDQDDIWYKNKLERATNILSQYSRSIPALYCSRTKIVDSTGRKHLGLSPLFTKPPSFSNALIQNIGGGNTMVFNKAARDLIVESSQNVNVVSHDWWTYIIVVGAGGVVYYDPAPSVYYRQHADNLVGANNSWLAHFKRAKAVYQGIFQNWNDINIHALSNKKYLLTAENQKILSEFAQARQARLLKRLHTFKAAGIHRQTLLGNISLFTAILFNKV